MKKILYTVLSVAVWVILVAYLVFAMRKCSKHEDDIIVESVEISITDASKINVISVPMVEKWLVAGGFKPVKKPILEVNTEEIRKTLSEKTFVKDVYVYTDMRGVLHIDLTQRRPIARFSTANGYNFYFSDDGWILPIPLGGAMHVPVVTGYFQMPFAKAYYGSLDEALDDDEKNKRQDYAFLLKLINFVKLTEEDPFWNAQIVQIVATQKGSSGSWKEPEIEIIPRVGDFVVGLGVLNDVQEKLDKLMLFYHNVLPYDGWDTYNYIDLKYKGQVVCSK